MRVRKAAAANGPAVSAVSSTWSFKAGARLAQGPAFFHQLLDYGKPDSTRSPRKSPSGWSCLGRPVLPRQERALSHLRTCRTGWLIGGQVGIKES